MSLAALLGVKPGLTALIGGGGKTTLLYALAEELKARGSVLVTTSTKIRVPEHLPVADPKNFTDLAEALKAASPLCLGSPWPEDKLAAPALPFGALVRAADFVLVEADGSRGLPAKAHADHEPVIPAEAGTVILVVGTDAFGRPIREVCHRPELYAERAGVPVDAIVTPEIAARVLRTEGYGNIVYVNKCEAPEDWENAEALASLLPASVIAGSLREGFCKRM